MTSRRIVISTTLTGVIVALPFGLLIWAGAEHGGRGPLLTPLYTGVVGAVLGFVLGALVLAVRAVWRRALTRVVRG
jgi:hypothetical protein